MPNIFARSPFIIEINEALQTSSKVELFIWNGTGSAPATPTYTLSKNVPSTTNLQTTYDVSPYVREFINFNTQVVLGDAIVLTNTSQWCNVRIKRYKNTSTLLDTVDYIAYDGYGYYEQGFNPDLGEESLAVDTYYFWNSGVRPADMFRSYLRAGDNVNYIDTISGTNDFLPITTSGVYNVPIARKDEFLTNGVTIRLLKSTGNKTYRFNPITECKYQVIPVDFVNKYGAWQKLWFFKASTNSIEVNGNEYNLMNSNIVNYNVLEPQKKTFNVNGVESIKVNSGWVDDSYAELIQQLLLSERILVDGHPANMKTKSLEKQKQINTKMINYQLEFQFAFDMINTVK